MRKQKNLKSIFFSKSYWLLAFGFWLFAGSALAQSDKKLLREGNKSYDNKKYSDAEVSYKKSLDKNQKSYEGNFNLGDAYYKQGKYDDAAKQFELLKSEKTDKKTEAAALHNLGNTLLKNKKYKESIDAFKQALKLNPNDEDTRYNLAYAQTMLKQEEQRKQQQQQQQQQNQDKNKDKKEQKPQQQKQEKQKQEQAQQKQQEQKKEISKEDAERILQALNNDEKDKHKKKAKVVATRVRIDKDW